MSKEESCYAYQCAARTQRCQALLLSQHLLLSQEYDTAELADADVGREEAPLAVSGDYLTMPTDRNANRQPSMPKG